MPDTSNIAINQSTAPMVMTQIQTDANSLLTEMEGKYSELAALIVNSKGDFIDALKVQIESELEMIRAAADFFLTLIQMMQAADEDFNRLDASYAERQIN
ncbi:MAG: hypothetical protein J1F18_03485 [Lachnospiraceae bacterium]|nr:hypothetical protein [Lachnospiraceae bacterium]